MSAAQTGVKVLSPLATTLLLIGYSAVCVTVWEIGKKLGRMAAERRHGRLDDTLPPYDTAKDIITSMNRVGGAQLVREYLETDISLHRKENVERYRGALREVGLEHLIDEVLEEVGS